jgi:GNAT superfamily N-acetyltransferase
LIEIDLRVAPGRRRSGVGKALYKALARPEDHLISSCDPAQRRAVKFLEARGFQMRSVLFAQRWDGEVDDVPAAFRSAVLADCELREDSWPILVESMAESWPGPSIDRRTFLDPDTRVRTASVDGQVVGVLAARRKDDAYSLGGMGVLEPWRKRGIGRVLLCEQMSLAAQENLGLVLHVAHDNETFLEWTRNLGFWTFRSWAIFERPPVS